MQQPYFAPKDVVQTPHANVQTFQRSSRRPTADELSVKENESGMKRKKTAGAPSELRRRSEPRFAAELAGQPPEGNGAESSVASAF
ncbi:hypothetical protein MRX96_013355 [Rhipicephalus microplus]